jgi:hypothetical protein
MTWDSAMYVEKIELTHTLSAPPDVLLARGPQIVEATAGGELHNVKPSTPEVRAEIDNELVVKSIDFMRRQTSAKRPFFLYLPFSMGHIPNLPSSQFKGKSRIGDYGDKLMEGDYHVGQILDALKQLGVDTTRYLCLRPTTDRLEKPFVSMPMRERQTWATPVRSVASLVKSPRARSGLSVSSVGRATSSQTRPPMPFFRLWISSRPSPASSGPRCPATVLLTALIRQTSYSARVRAGSATAF